MECFYANYASYDSLSAHLFLFSNNLLPEFHRVNPVLEQLTYKMDFYAVMSSVTHPEFHLVVNTE